MKTRYGPSPWVDQFPASRLRTHARHRGSLTTDIVVIGGGITGCATAYAFAAAGVKVVLLEAAQVGLASATSLGWIATEPGVSFSGLEKQYGLRHARRVFQAWRRAALDFAALVRRLDLKCQLEAQTSVLIARGPEQNAEIAREQKARKSAGLDASLLNSRATLEEVAIDATAAIKTRDGAVLDPYRLTLGLAAAAAERGVQIFERSPATRIKFAPKWVDVTTTDGTVRAERVVVATGAPTGLVKQLQRHCWRDSTFCALTYPIPAKIRNRLGRRTSVVRDSARPPHVVRWVGEDRVLVTGADSDLVSDRQREKTIVQRTGQLMYELSTLYPDISGVLPAYGWESPIVRTADALPLIGPHRNLPRHLFAFGDSSHSVTGAYLASRILLRNYQEDVDPADEVFGFTRVT